MERGELSNANVPRWIITLDTLVSDRLLPKKKRFSSWARMAEDTRLDRLVSGQMYQAADRFPIIFEGAVFGMPDSYTAALFKRLEDEAWLVRYITAYETRNALASDLPYRPDVRAVIDTPEHVLYWGSRGVTLQELVHRR